MIIVTGAVTAQEDSFDEALAIALEHVHRSRAEDGCILHSVHRDMENPMRLFFFEQWRDMAALKAHFAVPASQAFVPRMKAVCMAMEPISILAANPAG